MLEIIQNMPTIHFRIFGNGLVFLQNQKLKRKLENRNKRERDYCTWLTCPAQQRRRLQPLASRHEGVCPTRARTRSATSCLLAAAGVDPERQVTTHKYQGSIVVLLISKTVEPNEEQKEMRSGFQ